MDFTATLALIVFTIFLCLFIGGQYYLDRKRQRQYEREKAERMQFFEGRPTTDDYKQIERENAIVRSHVVKHQKRRARQRKAARRDK